MKLDFLLLIFRSFPSSFYLKHEESATRRANCGVGLVLPERGHGAHARPNVPTHGGQQQRRSNARRPARRHRASARLADNTWGSSLSAQLTSKDTLALGEVNASGDLFLYELLLVGSDNNAATHQSAAAETSAAVAASSPLSSASTSPSSSVSTTPDFQTTPYFTSPYSHHQQHQHKFDLRTAAAATTAVYQMTASSSSSSSSSSTMSTNSTNITNTNSSSSSSSGLEHQFANDKNNKLLKKDS